MTITVFLEGKEAPRGLGDLLTGPASGEEAEPAVKPKWI